MRKELQEYRRIEQEIKAFEAKEDIPALLALKVPEGEESLESLADGNAGPFGAYGRTFSDH